MSPKNQERMIDFMAYRKPALALSIILVVVAIIGIAVKGLDLGLDFTGGTQLRVTFEQTVELDPLRAASDEQGFTDAVVVYYGSESEVMIRFQQSLEELALTQINATLAQVSPGALVQEVLSESGFYQTRMVIAGAENLEGALEQVFPRAFYGQVSLEQSRGEATTVLLQSTVENAAAERFVTALEEATGVGATLADLAVVGSQVGARMAENAVLGLLAALGVIMLYVALRFQYKFAVSAVVGLAHDVVIVVGMFAIFDMGVDLTVFAAVLALIGYSINDTIVVEDRIRENFRKVRKAEPVEIINVSLNQTLARTIVTSLTTCLVLIALYFFGGDVIKGFSLALIVGIVVGTYSSNFAVPNILLAMKVSKEDLAVPVKEGAEFDARP